MPWFLTKHSVSRANHPFLPTIISFVGMSFIDTLNFCLSLFGFYSLVLYLRYLLPCHKIPPLSTFLDETQQLLDRAEAIGAISQGSENSAHLHLYGIRSVRHHHHVLTLAQFGKPICNDAHREQSCSGAIPAAARCYFTRPDVQTLFLPIPNRSYKIETRGLSEHSSCLSYHTLMKLSQLAVDEHQTTSTIIPKPAAGACRSVHRFDGYLPGMVP